MAYYGEGDFYMGDFYRGDPGLFSTLTRIGQAALGVIPGGGTAIQIARGVGGALVRRGAGAIEKSAAAAGGAIVRHPVLSAAGAAGALATAGGAGALAEKFLGGAPGMIMRGFHMTKPHRRYGVYPKPPHLARNRRMRVTNPRALRRSLRRISGFARIARRVLHFTHPRAARGRVRYRFPRRRKSA